jgi:hypothetical protein
MGLKPGPGAGRVQGAQQGVRASLLGLGTRRLGISFKGVHGARYLRIGASGPQSHILRFRLRGTVAHLH